MKQNTFWTNRIWDKFVDAYCAEFKVIPKWVFIASAKYFNGDSNKWYGD